MPTVVALEVVAKAAATVVAVAVASAEDAAVEAVASEAEAVSNRESRYRIIQT